MDKQPSLLKRLAPYMGNKKYLFPLSLFLSALSAVVGLLPFVFVWLIAKALFAPAVELGQASYYAWLALATAFVSMLLYFAALMCSHLAAFRVEVGMRKVAMRRIIIMPLGFFDHTQSGKIRKVIDDNASQTHSFLAHQLPDFSATIVAPLMLLALLFIIDWRMGLVSLIPTALGLFSMRFMMTEAGQKMRQQYMDSLEEMSSEAVEYVRGIPVAKTFGQSVHAFTRFVSSISRYKTMVMKFTLQMRGPMTFFTVIMQTTAFFLVPFALFFVCDDNLGQVLSNFLFYLLIAPNFATLFMRSMYFQNYASIATQTLDRFDALLDYPAMTFVERGDKPTHFDVAFDKVSFTYQGAERKAVDDVSFHIAEGETVALIGTSGGGKTTIARLLARFWDVQSGEIRIGGHPINQLSRSTLMNSIAFVFQCTKLFPMSLRDNITYGNADASDADIERAIDLSQSREIIDKLPSGLATEVGAAGTYLSGGEQQRIALARAILKDAPIVILDEATAFADPENEQLIQQALRELSQGKTTLMIAHRLTTVKNADKILVVDNGNIIERGTHDELLQAGGAYKTMWQEYQQSIEWKLDNTGGAQ